MALEALPQPETEITPDGREAARARAIAAADRVRPLELQLHEAEGALQQVGGQYIDEQFEDAQDALDAVANREHEVDLEYGAWNLLLETLKEAEAEDAVHLGNALVGPVSERMSELTRGRYGDLSIAPKLQTRGIEIAGAERGIDQLSRGTQEQIATLFRLSVAEALGTVLVLDDQLTQTDAARMAWLRDLLRGCAGEIQIVVFTCRPGDYLSAEEVGGAPFEKGRLKALDLQVAIERSTNLMMP